MTTDFDYFNNKRPEKVYISKRFVNKNLLTDEEIKVRRITKVFDVKDFQSCEYLKEFKSIVLRKTPSKREEVILSVLEEEKKITGISIQRFVKKSGIPKSESFHFLQDEFRRMLDFLNSVGFLDFSNPENSQIKDSDINIKVKDLSLLAKKFNDLSKGELQDLLSNDDLKGRDFVNLAFRNDGLATFRKWISEDMSDEKKWQEFFQKHNWIFGYGLDYRFMTIFDREMSVGNGGVQDQNKPLVDFLNEYNDFTVLVELKTPKTILFDKNKNRSGCWKFNEELIDAYSQVLEQKAEWSIKGDYSNNLSKDGTRRISSRTRDPKVILIIGNKKKQILDLENIAERELKMDTFELFRRDSRNIEIITYDELLERAEFIMAHKI